MITLQEIIWGYVLPVAMVLAGFMVIIYTQRIKAGGLISNTTVAVIPAMAFSVGFWRLYGWPGWVPLDSTHWILHLVLICGVIGLMRKPNWLRRFLHLLLACISPWLLLRPIIQYDWTTHLAMAWITAYFLAILLQMALLEHLAENLETARLLMLLFLIAAATTVVMSLSGSLALAKISGILTTILLTGYLLSRWLPKEHIASPLIPLVVLVLSMMWLSGFYFAELNAVNACLLFASVPLAWLGLWFKLDRRSAWQSLILHTCLVGLPLAIAFTRALMLFFQNEANRY